MSMISIIEKIHQGVPIVIVDSHDRENEADLFLAAEMVNKDNLNFLIQQAKGLMCIPCDGLILDRLKIPMMVQNSTDKFLTPFTVTVDAANGTTSGMSVADRLKTISIFTNNSSQPNDLNRPGHLMPLRARKNLLLDRQGHTETAIELCKLANLKSVGVICEMIDESGNMMKGDKLRKFIKKFKLTVISVEEIKDHVY